MKRPPLPGETIFVFDHTKFVAVRVHWISSTKIYFCFCTGCSSPHRHPYNLFVRRFDEGVTWTRPGVDTRAMEAALILKDSE